MKINTVFLDRDGVLNADSPNYIRSLDDVRVHYDVPGAIRTLTEEDKRLIVISNQAGIGKGLLSVEDAEAIFDKIIEGAEAAGGKIMARYYCPHKPEDKCKCRKPKTGMFRQAVKDHGIRLEQAVFVGDGYADALTAKALHIPFYLVAQGWGPETRQKCDEEDIPYIYVSNLQDAVDMILESEEDEI